MAAQSLYIQGSAGRLEALWQLPTFNPHQAALICHPLPTEGGTMHNKVVHTMTGVFAKAGMGVMRFNTRGTGRSQGNFDNGRGELDDAECVTDYLLAEHRPQQLWLAGFSFGSYLAWTLAQMRPDIAARIAHLILVGPPVERWAYPLNPHVHLPFPLTLMQGDADEIVPSGQVFAWADQVASYSKDFALLRFADGGHFFHGRLLELRDSLTERLAAVHPELHNT